MDISSLSRCQCSSNWSTDSVQTLSKSRKALKTIEKLILKSIWKCRLYGQWLHWISRSIWGTLTSWQTWNVHVSAKRAKALVILTLFWLFFFLPTTYSLNKEFWNSNPKVDSFFPFLMSLQFYIKTFSKSLDQSYFPSFAELFWTYYFSKIWSFFKNVFKVDLSVSNLQRFCVPEDILNWLSHLNKNLTECIK